MTSMANGGELHWMTDGMNTLVVIDNRGLKTSQEVRVLKLITRYNGVRLFGLFWLSELF